MSTLVKVNNAGVAHVGTVLETEDEDFDRVVVSSESANHMQLPSFFANQYSHLYVLPFLQAVNMKGVFHCAKSAVRHMKSDKKGGVILNTVRYIKIYGTDI